MPVVHVIQHGNVEISQVLQKSAPGGFYEMKLNGPCEVRSFCCVAQVGEPAGNPRLNHSHAQIVRL